MSALFDRPIKVWARLDPPEMKEEPALWLGILPPDLGMRAPQALLCLDDGSIGIIEVIYLKLDWQYDAANQRWVSLSTGLPMEDEAEGETGEV